MLQFERVFSPSCLSGSVFGQPQNLHESTCTCLLLLTLTHVLVRWCVFSCDARATSPSVWGLNVCRNKQVSEVCWLVPWNTTSIFTFFKQKQIRKNKKKKSLTGSSRRNLAGTTLAKLLSSKPNEKKKGRSLQSSSSSAPVVQAMSLFSSMHWHKTEVRLGCNNKSYDHISNRRKTQADVTSSSVSSWRGTGQCSHKMSTTIV